jgi:hypothetical protein
VTGRSRWNLWLLDAIRAMPVDTDMHAAECMCAATIHGKAIKHFNVIETELRF